MAAWKSVTNFKIILGQACFPANFFFREIIKTLLKARHFNVSLKQRTTKLYVVLWLKQNKEKKKAVTKQ